MGQAALVVQRFVGSRPSLYERLGGAYSIAAVVDRLIDVITVDPQVNSNPLVNEAHRRVSKPGLKYQVWELLCEATGGPNKYVGRDMKTAHAHLNITTEEWFMFGTDFKNVLDEFKVPAREQVELFDVLAALKDDIVNKNPGATPKHLSTEHDEIWSSAGSSLYTRIGGIYAIAAICGRFIERTMENPSLKKNPAVFAASSEYHRKAGHRCLLTQFMGMSTGGPQVYTGKSRREASADMNIRRDEWTTLTNDLVLVLKEFSVPEDVRREMVKLVEPMQADVVAGGCKCGYGDAAFLTPKI